MFEKGENINKNMKRYDNSKKKRVNIIKAQKDQNILSQGYYKICNKDCNIPYLTFKELGLLHYLLSKPPAWEFTQDSILEDRNQEYQVLPERQLRNTLKNLKTLGFVKIDCVKDIETNNYHWRTRVSINPFDTDIFTEEEIEELKEAREKELESRKNQERFKKNKSN